MFKRDYKVLWHPELHRLESAVCLELGSEGWVPLGGAVFVNDPSGANAMGWYQTMWLPEDPWAGKVTQTPGSVEEILMENHEREELNSVNFAGGAPEGKYVDDE